MERSWYYEEEVFRMNVVCPKCHALAPQYISYADDGSWDTTTECSMCDYKDDYHPDNPHGVKGA